jgi:hypothetical protein
VSSQLPDPDQGHQEPTEPADLEPDETFVPTSSPSAWGRRGLVIAAVCAVPVVGLLGFNALRAGTDPQSVPTEPELLPTEDPSDEYVNGFEISVGDYSATVPDGWKTIDDGKGGVVASNGANRLLVVSVSIPPSALAVDEIDGLARSHAEGFVGTFDAPVDRSSANVKRASVAGTGKFQGAPARFLSELWIDSTGFALLTTRTLTAKPDSAISAQAQEMVDELSLDF